MKKIIVPASTYMAVIAGVQNVIVVNENEEYMVNTPVILEAESFESLSDSTGRCVISINSIVDSKAEKGLKKDFSMLMVSVVRHLPLD